ncbi:tryptophan-rich sensory protein [Elizabethkingia sp. HX WHF]|uniref:TspO/MBR family protein n=1 Tax=Elizabethkingia TaxID=308865 RepID=UPI00099B1036|nr:MULTISPECIES: TspO/MBR family protein [Elizabethkingia]ATL44215.1 tryptophan-rich sensory protein [Elizabethkingia miricola]MCL1639772.1 tryptophan-rich sensory protein [Elizabethkingia bruuniana]MDX8565566.1 tryptophan-rich sensory protein [Elizabethkingia sp. HX WHF]OPC27508.1 sensory protein [Elizabethkingia bruuniana]OPC52517.1 sensory protein [Elizabethkingia bruuniana]
MKRQIDWKALAACISFHVFVFFIIHTLTPANSFNVWYNHLDKPLFTPPSNFLFRTIFLMYFFSGFAFYFIWKAKETRFKHRQRALIYYYIIFVLISLWFIIFFNFKLLDLAVIVNVITWVMTIILFFLFKRVSKTASYLILPTLLWDTFNMVLSWGFWQLNH